MRDRRGAGVLVTGGAGMARCRADLDEAVQIPVVEPTQAAVTLAIGRIRLGWSRCLAPQCHRHSGMAHGGMSETHEHRPIPGFQ